MFAINHAATALILARAFPGTPLPLLLGSVQLVEVGWVALNLVGLETTVTESVVRSVADIHLAHMPWSHSVLGTLVCAGAAALVAGGLLRSGRAAIAVGLGVLSHLLLDLLTHAPDIAWAPGVDAPKLGLGLYAMGPAWAFGLELIWGVLCWTIYRGSWRLLAAIVAFNVGNLTMFTDGIVGVEGLLAGRPTVIVLVIAAQIAVTLLAVGWLGRDTASAASGRVSTAPPSSDPCRALPRG